MSIERDEIVGKILSANALGHTFQRMRPAYCVHGNSLMGKCSYLLLPVKQKSSKCTLNESSVQHNTSSNAEFIEYTSGE